MCFPSVLAKGQRRVMPESDSELIKELSVSRTGWRARDEILRRGVRMIPLLLKVKGDQRTAYTALGHHLSATPTIISINPPDAEPGRVLTMEVAALYLICAIYYNTIEFAQSPYLSDRRLPADQRTGRNTPDLVARAWAAVEEWSRRLDGTTIENLRSLKDDPLRGSDVGFW